MAGPLAALLALALAVAPVPSVSPTESADDDSEPADITAPAEPTAAVMEGPAEPPTVDVVPGSLCHGSKPCKRLVVLASVSGGLGLSAILAGGILAARPQQVDPDDPTKAIAYRPAGAAALAIGLGVLATGLLMTFAAVRASRQAKQGAARAALHRPARLAW